jgi:hypothetical protein
MFPHASDVIAPSGQVVLEQGPSASREGSTSARSRSESFMLHPDLGLA